MQIRRLSSVTIMAGLVAAAMSMPSGGASAATMCYELWQPVCGKVGGVKRTYSNACWAKMAKARILHQGACK